MNVCYDVLDISVGFVLASILYVNIASTDSILMDREKNNSNQLLFCVLSAAVHLL